MSTVTTLAEGHVIAAGTITVELVEADETPTTVIICSAISGLLYCTWCGSSLLADVATRRYSLLQSFGWLKST